MGIKNIKVYVHINILIMRKEAFAIAWLTHQLCSDPFCPKPP